MSDKDLPSWSEGDLNNPAFMVMKLRQLTEATQTLMGTRNQSGTGLEPGWYRAALAGGGGGTTVIGGGGGSGVSTDLTPPPAPTGLQVSGGLSSIGVVFDAPTYTQGGGNAYTVIYGAKWIPDAPEPNPKPTFANAVQLGSLPGRSSVMFIATEPDTYWCIWATFVTTAGVPGQPGGGTNGAQGQTGQDPSVLLDLLSGQITESELYGDLNARINLVDGPDTLPGSVAARVLAEAQARGTAITEEATVRLNSDSAIAQSVTNLSATVTQNNTTLTSAIQSEATARVAGDQAEATARQTLAAGVASAINHADTSWWAPGASLPSGWIYNPQVGENSFVLSTDHTGKPATVWRCASGDSSNTGGEEPDGGWQAALPALDRNKTYRFMVPVRRNAGVFGRAYWGLYGVEQSSNPYFAYPNLQDMAVGVWYWLVGYVYPQGEYGQRGNDGAGAYASTTGAKIFDGFNYYWHATAAQYHRAYLYYGEPGAQIDFGRPLVHLVDGNEPPLDAIIKGTAGAVAAAQALVQTEASARQTGDTALAQSITTLSATVGDNAAAIQTVAAATADLEGHVAASYSVRAQVTAGGRTAVGGFGLTGEVGESGPTITFGVVANQFWVGAPEGTPGVNADILPFVIQTAPTVVNGVTIPAGVYMDAAYITNLTALIARLGTAWIDSAMIADLSAGKITSGSLQVGEYIQSTGYVPGVDGLRITGSGSAEFSSIIARGTIYASAGSIGSILIAGNGLQSAGYGTAAAGFNIDGSAGKITVIGDGMDVKSSTSGARMETRSDRIRVFDTAGVRRIIIGNLAE